MRPGRSIPDAACWILDPEHLSLLSIRTRPTSDLWQPAALLSTYLAYAMRVSKKKNVLRTSFRSAAQATDSTRSGCQANRAATLALHQILRVSPLNSKNSSAALAL